MTILVTGSAGHLGEAILRVLRDQGRPAVGVDIKPSPFTGVVGSIADPKVASRAMDGARAVIHAATLHKPHVATHSRQDFIEVNVTGTLALLEAAVAAKVEAFVFTSTTSAFGGALSPPPGEPAAWIDEDVVAVPKNIYGATKTAAEGLCELFARTEALPTVILRTARFFPEADDDPALRGAYGQDNIQANELLYRRADIADVVEAHLLAIERAGTLGFGRYVISATTPFTPRDLANLRVDAPSVLRRLFPDFEDLYAACGWRMFDSLDRIYANGRARADLDWRPVYDFAHALDALRVGADVRSPLARAVGSKGYHDRPFGDDAPYPIAC